MNVPQQLAQHVREVFFGGNWTESALKEHVTDVTWQQATARVGSLNTIAALVYHSHYYISALLQVLRAEPLTARDKDSFEHPPIHSAEAWESLLANVWEETEAAALLIEQLPEAKLWETFVEEKYGTYYRNIQGIIEHTHYHLGQIVLLKKLLPQTAETSSSPALS
ncbi:DinB family protein [Rufibacter sediminis]|uniref:DUF1572 domain-containing protein n=1 Tax=Rufibacter sediminis TaxID=2762756 RepID=A0ABR6VQ49_9BACT|nr:DinB family protein [Rufibacter sediminis]MBC3539055.1 DUF1572 domain-containing protein [Rufibacter sediminis]